LRFVFGPYDVRMCRVFVCPRLILPVPVLLKRLAAPVWVFNLGIVFSLSAEASKLSLRLPWRVARETGVSPPS
jgi:hypothetical protein